MILKNKNTEYNPKIKKPTIAIVLFVLSMTVGTIGYKILWSAEGASWIDAFYMTFISVATIGYGEIHPLDATGRVFTIFICSIGIASLFYLFTYLMENLVLIQSSNLKGIKKMKKNLEGFKEHIIGIGYGRVGKIVVNELLHRGKKIVVIDSEFKGKIESFDSDKIIGLEGDATDDELLIQAGIERASSVIVATGSSAITVFVVISARELNKDLFILARADDDLVAKKLLKAGADRIVNTYSSGGEKLANIAMNPQITDFIESNFIAGGKKLKLEQYLLPNDCHWDGMTLAQMDIRNKCGATIVGIVRDNEPILNPSGIFTVKIGDQLIAFGSDEQLEKFNEVIKNSKKS